jgi:hypothetical protein
VITTNGTYPWSFGHRYSVAVTQVMVATVKLFEEFEDTKGVIRIRISKNRQHNGKKKVQSEKQRSTKHTYKTKDRVTRTQG